MPKQMIVYVDQVKYFESTWLGFGHIVDGCVGFSAVKAM